MSKQHAEYEVARIHGDELTTDIVRQFSALAIAEAYRTPRFTRDFTSAQRFVLGDNSEAYWMGLRDVSEFYDMFRRAADDPLQPNLYAAYQMTDTGNSMMVAAAKIGRERFVDRYDFGRVRRAMSRQALKAGLVGPASTIRLAQYGAQINLGSDDMPVFAMMVDKARDDIDPVASRLAAYVAEGDTVLRERLKTVGQSWPRVGRRVDVESGGVTVQSRRTVVEI